MSFASTSQCPDLLDVFYLICSPEPAGKSRSRNLCATCLCTRWDDELHPFTEELTIILRLLLNDFDLDGCLKLVLPEKGIKLCDWCLKKLQDIYFFKQKALNSLSQLKKQWEVWFNKRNEIIQNRPHPVPEDTLIVTTVKTEIKEEPDPLDIPTLTVLSHTTPEANVSELEAVNSKEANVLELEADIKEEIHIDNDQWNTEDNSDTESADSADMVDEIKKSSVRKTVRFQTDVIGIDSGPKYRHSSATVANVNSSRNLGMKRKIIVKKNIKSNRNQNAARPLLLTASKPELSFRVTSDSSYMPVKLDKLSSFKAGPSALLKTMPQSPVPTSQAQVKMETTKDQQDTEMPHKRSCPDTDSDFKESERIRKFNVPWYITFLTREQLVKIREDLLNDPSFAKAAYKCMNCAQTFKLEKYWNKHKRRCHGGSKKNGNLSCFVCGLRFDTISLLSLHMRFHSLGHHTYQCSTCDYTTKDMYFVTRHRCPNEGGETVPPKDPTMKLAKTRRQLYCPACDYVSQHEVNLHYIRYHTNNGPVECEVCHMSFKKLDTMLSHKYKVHPRKPPAEKKEVMFCAPCLKSFYTKATYRAHMRTVKHAAKDQLNISCDECPKKFHLQVLYERHKRSHELVRSGTKPHECPHCGLRYVFKSTLGAHIRSKHTNRQTKRDHICDVCGAAFKSGATLRGHMARHSDERPYRCEYCGDTFKYSGAKYTHIKLKHKKKKTKPDDGNKGTRKSARIRKRNKGKGDEHEQSEHDEQSMESHEQEQSIESSLYEGDMGSLENYDKILEMQNVDESMEV